MTLASLGGAPFHFAVKVAGAGATAGTKLSLEVTGADPPTGLLKKREYRLPDRGHNSYLDLFEGLAKDFGGRTPRARRPPAAPAPGASYRALLTENIAPGILYGYGDPSVLRVGAAAGGGEGGWYYLISTSNDAPDSFPIIRSRDLAVWEFVGFVFPRGEKPAWAADGELVSDFWAPEMHEVGGEFRVYFAARDRHTRGLAIGVAKSAGPRGPFKAADAPLLSGDVIDPHVLVEDDGTALLYWKEDNNGVWPSLLSRLLRERAGLVAALFPRREDQITASLAQALWPWARALEPMERFFVQQTLIEAVTSSFSSFRDRLLAAAAGGAGGAGIRDDIGAVLRAMRTPVYAQELSPDGLSLVGGRSKVIENDQAWEAHLIEGVWVTKQRGRYYLFYAGNDFSTPDYGIGVAVAPSPLGPYRKLEGPLLGSTAEWSGPGHPSVAAGPGGEPLLFFHAFFPGRAGYREFRALLAARVRFEADGVLLG